MAYPKQTWDTSSYVNPTRMNHIEDGIKSAVDGLTNIYIEGSTNNTGSTIASETYFYLNGALVRAKTDIANGATLTVNTNYEVVTAGGLNDVTNRTNYTLTLAEGFEKLTSTKNYCYKRNNEIHLHCAIYKSAGYSAGTYAYPFTIPSSARPSSNIITECTFYSAGGTAGSQRGVPGWCTIGSNGQIIVMPIATGTNVNCAVIDIVFPLD